MSRKKLTAVFAALAALCAAADAAELNAYSVMPEKYASRIFAEFTKDTGIKVNFLSLTVKNGEKPCPARVPACFSTVRKLL